MRDARFECNEWRRDDHTIDLHDAWCATRGKADGYYETKEFLTKAIHIKNRQVAEVALAMADYIEETQDAIYRGESN